MVRYKKMRKRLGNLIKLVWRESDKKNKKVINENGKGVGRNVSNDGTERGKCKEVT